MRLERSARTFTGVDWRGEPRPPLRSGDAVHFCDLRGCRLYKSDLAEVEFVGCRLNDASFRGAVLDRSRFIGCFAADTLPPMNLAESARAEMQVIDCHLHVVVEESDDKLLRARWPTAVAGAAADTLDELPDVRYEACAALARLDDQRAAYIVACLLADEHWQVRLAALRTLGTLYHGGFTHAQQAMTEWIFLRLGDEHSLVRREARKLIALMRPSQETLRQSVERMRSGTAPERLEGLRAAMELARGEDDGLPRLVDIELVKSLLRDAAPAVRAEAVHLLGILDEPSSDLWARALADPDSGVRAQALQAVRLLSDPPDASSLVALLHDPDEAVRLETLYTLGQLGFDDVRELRPLLQDASSAVRQATEALLSPS